ncbi:MAG: hypothetical protein IPO21_21220 [Bacteroidales bacterium]|nr:hypothetical protein [Bacteroidales bacterium]
MYIRVILFFAAILVIFSHFYFGFKSVIPSNSIARYNFLWLIILLVFLSGMIGMVVFFMKGIGEQNILVNVILLVNFLIVIPVAIMSIFMLSLDFIRLISSFILWIGQHRPMFPMVAAPIIIYKSIAYIGLLFAVLVLWGGTFGKYWFKVHEQHLYFNDLPKEFEGFKIVQISDIHTGKY